MVCRDMVASNEAFLSGESVGRDEIEWYLFALGFGLPSKSNGV